MTTPFDKTSCFGPSGRTEIGRIHLPVAPRANLRLRFGAPPMPHGVMAPADALAWMHKVIADGAKIGVVGITGPGEPMAAAEPTLEALALVRQTHPWMTLTLCTNGLDGGEHAATLARLGLGHVTMLIDAVDPAVAETIYAWVRPGQKTMPLPTAVRTLLAEQERAVRAYKAAGLMVKINTTVYPGLNDHHISDIATAMAGLGADVMALIPFRAAEGDENPPHQPGVNLMASLRDKVSAHIPTVPAFEHCGRDMVGLELPEAPAVVSSLPTPSKERPNVAVASSDGMDADLHLGQAVRFLIYGPREQDGLPCLLAPRDAPAPGGGDARWQALAKRLSDCFAIVVDSAGAHPQQVLRGLGLRVLTGGGEVSGVVDVLYGGGKKKGCKPKRT